MGKILFDVYTVTGTARLLSVKNQVVDLTDGAKVENRVK